MRLRDSDAPSPEPGRGQGLSGSARGRAHWNSNSGDPGFAKGAPARGAFGPARWLAEVGAKAHVFPAEL
eukprot:1155057-Alexandrium_andersonii.AAC.1